MGARIASLAIMRRISACATLVLPVLLSASAADAQGLDAGLPAGSTPGVVAPSLQSYLLLQLLALQASRAGARAPTADEISRAAADYFTNGAEATSVPTAGPAAAYFTNGAEVLAAQTSVVPAPPPPAGAIPQALPPTASSQAATSNPVYPPAAAGSSETSRPPSAEPSEAGVGEMQPEAPGAPSESGERAVEAPSSPDAETPAVPELPSGAATAPPPTASSGPSEVPPNVAPPRASALGLPGPKGTFVPLWYPPMLGLGGVGVGALLVFLGTRLRPPRDHPKG